jgi:hypothetical protein
VIYDDLVDVIDSLDVAYQVEGCQWQFSQAMRKVMRKIKDTQGPPDLDAELRRRHRRRLQRRAAGLPGEHQQRHAAPGANAKSMAFGNFKQYMIRDAMEVTLFRFEDSAFMAKGQVGFLAWARMGGNLLDVNASRRTSTRPPDVSRAGRVQCAAGRPATHRRSLHAIQAPTPAGRARRDPHGTRGRFGRWRRQRAGAGTRPDARTHACRENGPGARPDRLRAWQGQ